MSKPCSVCLLPKEAHHKIEELYKEGVSRKKIVETISKKFFIPVTVSSLNRHLKNCLKKQSVPRDDDDSRLALLKEKARWNPLQEKIVYKAICNLFYEEIERYIRRANSADSQASRQDDLKCLDLLINMMLKLYPAVKDGVDVNTLEDGLYVDKDEFVELLKIKIRLFEEAKSRLTPEERAEFEKQVEKQENNNPIDNLQGKAIVFEEVFEWLAGKKGFFDEKGLKVVNPQMFKLYKHFQKHPMG